MGWRWGRKTVGGIGDEAVLRNKARMAMQSGRLPSCSPEQTWGGPGAGDRCAVCDQPVTRDQIELELRFPPQPGGRAIGTSHLHIECFSAWERERQNLKPGRVADTVPDSCNEGRCRT